MYRSRRTAEEPTSAPTLTPGPISESTKRLYFVRGALEKLRGNRMFLIAMGELFVIVVLSLALKSLFPLKQVDVVRASSDPSGRVNVDRDPITGFVPNRQEISYFMAQWVENIFDVNRSTLDDRIEAAGNQVVGDAVDQLNELIKAENPKGKLRTYPQYRRTFRALTVNFLSDDTLFIRFELTERFGQGSRPITSIGAMTITYTRVPSKKPELVFTNPGGLYISSFNYTAEK